uniref:RNA polymerase beta' subunit n=1 Tax=Fibrocapsa japonica TaxID=94617 RepID=UPI0021144F15|nr:RNA polymerase beta' subunit [Fibrocapsa japonica]UTE95177.1 RNA polymerase beta' subunit [Fibrocapsa japonica]
MTILNEKFDYININLASPEKIKNWAERLVNGTILVGQIEKTDTINYRTYKPEKGGLFCERIFGPVKSWECSCGLYKYLKKPGFFCEICGVELTDSRVRRHRMGYISLLAPVTHVWYLKSSPSYISLILNRKQKDVEKVVYFIRPFDEPRTRFTRYLKVDRFGRPDKLGYFIRDKMGAEPIQRTLKSLDLKCQLRFARRFLTHKSVSKKVKGIKTVRVLESFIGTGVDPTWVILSILPVIPPGLRPMIQLDGGRFATSDLNDLYRRVITRNNRLDKLLEIKAPTIILRNEKRLLQEGVDTLIDNGRRGEKVVDTNNRPLKSLKSAIGGKLGRFRQNLLGKRVDYSGRSVVAVGPNLKLHQCGVPYEIAIELFKPFLLNELLEKGVVGTIRSAEKLIVDDQKLGLYFLKKILKTHPILLNRAPTLHKLGLQAFETVITNERAILLHPLVCNGFNADFDGDQMAIHVPLSVEARAEATSLLLGPCNFLSPSSGTPIVATSQDIVLGCFYLTKKKSNFFSKGREHYFSNTNDALLCYENKKLNLHTQIWVRYQGFLQNDLKIIKQGNNKEDIEILTYRDMQVKKTKNNKVLVAYIKTTPGRIIFNNLINKSLHS